MIILSILVVFSLHNVLILWGENYVGHYIGQKGRVLFEAVGHSNHKMSHESIWCMLISRKPQKGEKSFVWGFSCFICWWSNSSCHLVEEKFLKKSQNYANLLCSHLQIRRAINYLWRYYFMPKYNISTYFYNIIVLKECTNTGGQDSKKVLSCRNKYIFLLGK